MYIVRNFELFIFMGTNPQQWQTKKPATDHIKQLQFKLNTRD